jgi:hypothetical protein
MSLSILQVCNAGGYYLPLCGVCSLFLRGEFPYLKGDEEHALYLVGCLDDLEDLWGEMSSISFQENRGGCWLLGCALCNEHTDPSLLSVAVVEFESKECAQ